MYLSLIYHSTIERCDLLDLCDDYGLAHDSIGVMVARTLRDELCELVAGDTAVAKLWASVDNGQMENLVPEILDLRMEQDPVMKHKDNLWHTITVVGQAEDDLIVRLAALFHDVGKPATRRYIEGEVTFRDHEIVGARLTRIRLLKLGFAEHEIHDVSELVRLSGRFKGYQTGWSDSAVRRYARDADYLLVKLNALIRADCTTKHQYKRDELHRQVDDLERRIYTIVEAERIAAERPQIDGGRVMSHLGISPGPTVGNALQWLLRVKRSERRNTREGVVGAPGFMVERAVRYGRRS